MARISEIIVAVVAGGFLAAVFFTGGVTEFGPARQEITVREFAVVRVIDGDTFTIMYDGEETSVRFANFDAPEPREPGGPEASERLRKLIEGKVVTLEFTCKKKRDNFGRLLATVFVDGVDVGYLMKKRPGVNRAAGSAVRP